MIELPNSTLIGKRFGCLVIKCWGDDEMEVGGRRSERRKKGARETWGGRETEDRKEGRGREQKKRGKSYLEETTAGESARELLEV